MVPYDGHRPLYDAPPAPSDEHVPLYDAMVPVYDARGVAFDGSPATLEATGALYDCNYAPAAAPSATSARRVGHSVMFHVRSGGIVKQNQQRQADALRRVQDFLEANADAVKPLGDSEGRRQLDAAITRLDPAGRRAARQCARARRALRLTPPTPGRRHASRSRAYAQASHRGCRCRRPSRRGASRPAGRPPLRPWMAEGSDLLRDLRPLLPRQRR